MSEHATAFVKVSRSSELGFKRTNNSAWHRSGQCPSPSRWPDTFPCPLAPRTVHVALNDGGERTISADRVFLNLGTHATVPDIPGLRDSVPMTHVEALDLQRLPEHLIVIGGGYVGLELSQALRRLGSQVTVLQRGSQLASDEDTDVSDAILQLFRDEGIEVLLHTQISRVSGFSGRRRLETPREAIAAQTPF